MTPKIARNVLFGSTLFIVLAFTLRRVSPGNTTAFTGAIAIGVLLFFCVVGFWLGEKKRVWLITTAAISSIFLLVQAATVWVAPSGGSEARSGLEVAIISGMLFLSFGTLLYSVHADRPPDFYGPDSAATEGDERRRRFKDAARTR